VFLDIGKMLSFILSILSLYAVLESAFFIPGSDWQERLSVSLLRGAIAAGVCLGSGMLFVLSRERHARTEMPITSTLPMQMFFWAMAGVVILSTVSWYLEVYYVPLLWRSLPPG
jgi:formate/nitrite transporter FocA (FNT family)